MPESSIIDILIERGALIHNPNSVDIDKSVCLNKISSKIEIFPGSRITGSDTSIGPSCVIGKEAPVTIDNCQLSYNVSLMGGYFSNSVFLDGTKVGLGAHIRPGTILEEYSSCAHTVGLKQTILMPYVTLGSIINFCDCLMAGGTNKKNHSEVGSSYIHFNFTPNQDKATPSLLGDVPRGVMLNNSPIFLGGQGGIVGPSVLEFGTIAAAGTIIRADVKEQGKLVVGRNVSQQRQINFNTASYNAISRILDNNFNYIGNLHALYHWYNNMRTKFINNDPYRQDCIDGALRQIIVILSERRNRLDELASKLPSSIEQLSTLNDNNSAQNIQLQKEFIKLWPNISGSLDIKNTLNENMMNPFLDRIDKLDKNNQYIDTVHAFDKQTREMGTIWLKSIVQTVKDQTKL